MMNLHFKQEASKGQLHVNPSADFGTFNKMNECKRFVLVQGRSIVVTGDQSE